jgi:hypothetical protein
VSDQNLDTQLAGGEGSPGNQTDAVTVDCPTRGTIKLGGTINTLTCFLTDEPADDEIVFSLAGTDVLTIMRPAGSEYLQGTPAEIDIVAAADEAGITPSEGTSHELIVKRKRTHCADPLSGAQQYTLLTATLNWKNPTLNASISFPSQVLPGQPAEAEVQVEVVDQFGEAATFADIDVTLQVSGGTASTLSGRTDSNGRFTTTITPSTAAFAKRSNGVQGVVNIDAEARSFEGVTANASKSALIGEQGTVTLLGVDRQLVASAYCMGTNDGQTSGDNASGTWSDDLSSNSQGSTQEPPRQCSAETNASHNSNIVVMDGQVVEMSGTMGGDYSVNGSNLNFPQDVLANAYSHIHVSFKVEGKPVPFVLTASGSGADGSIQVFLTDVVSADGASTNVNKSGVLEPGEYDLRIDVGTSHRCSDCTANGNVSVTFSLKMGAAVGGGR